MGYVGGFLFLEVAGLVIDPVVILVLLAVARRHGLSAETFIGYGFGFTLLVDPVLWTHLFVSDGPTRLGWTVVGLAIGPVIVMVGLLIAWRADP